MKRTQPVLWRRYKQALQRHLEPGAAPRLDEARSLGSRALSAGLQTLDLAKLHEQIVVRELLAGCPQRKRAVIIRKAGVFFAAAITLIEKTQKGALKATADQEGFIRALSQRTVQLAASNRELSQEIAYRKVVEEKLKKSERHSSDLLAKSDRLQEQLRRLSRQILSAQEDERKKISRELHDVIAQTLTGINVRLATLRKEAGLNMKGLERNIARTQKLVQRSVEIVHRFARELRPAVLDDLGLIPALETFLKNFRGQTGIRICLTAFAGVEQVRGPKRTVLYRIAQEALTNVARHAQARLIDVKIVKLDGTVCMAITDDGRGFNVESQARGKENQRLGLLGMRERLEMVGGKFTVTSAPGQGTTVRAEIPLGNRRLPATAQIPPPYLTEDVPPLNAYETNHRPVGRRPPNCARRILVPVETRSGYRSHRRG